MQTFFICTDGGRDRSPASEHAFGFTLIELLVVIGVIAILASLLLPTLARAKAKAQATACVNNTKQLALSWHIYLTDNSDRTAGNLDGIDASNRNKADRTWCAGFLNSEIFTPDNTNIALLTSSQLGRYISPGIYRCPSDPSLSRVTSGIPRVRSYSMNCYIGDRPDPWTPGYKQFRRGSAFVKPAETCLFLDERADSINDACFITEMGTEPRGYRFLDFAASYHDGIGILSFVDGHVEKKKWLDPRSRPVFERSKTLPLTDSPNNPDIKWLQEHSSEPK